MFTSEKVVRAIMSHDITVEEGDLALDVALAVERGVTCPISGKVLDSRTAFALRVENDDGKWATTMVVDPSVTEREGFADDMDGAMKGNHKWEAVNTAAIWEKIDG